MRTVIFGRTVSLGLVVAAGGALADAAQDCRDAAAAAEAREAACRTALGEAAAFEDLGWVHINSGRPEDALAAARRALDIADRLTADASGTAQTPPHPVEALAPWHEPAQGLLLQAMAETGAAEEALATYREGQAAGVEDEAGHRATGLAWGLHMAGDREAAQTVIDDWLAAHPLPADGPVPPDYPSILDTAAHVWAAAGRADEAVAAFLQAAELGGPSWRTEYRLHLSGLGFPPGPGEEGLEAALRACVATREACKLFWQTPS